MHSRALAGTLRRLLKRFPAVALLGPRQSGKTTLARSIGGEYYDLEDEPQRTRIDAEWPLVERSRNLVVLDEAQSHPAVFSRLRGTIDRDRKRNGRFLLLGSVSPVLMRRVSESLAGRLAVAELTPFLAGEIPAGRLDRLWARGGFPDGGVLGGGGFPRWQEEYLRLLAQRDLPEWGLSARPAVTGRLMKMVAAVHGQVWNASDLARSLGYSYHTVNSYLDFLEAAYLIRRLPAYDGGLRKRLIRSPKVWIRDTGALHALKGLDDEGALLRQPWVGASWEGFVIEQLLGTLRTLDRRFDAFFLRTKDGEEIDLVLETGQVRWAVEIKLTARPAPEDFARLERHAELVGASRRVLVSRFPGIHGTPGRWMADLPGLLRLVTGKQDPRAEGPVAPSGVVIGSGKRLS